MISTKILEPKIKAEFEQKLLKKLQLSKELESRRVINSPRAVGDIVQEIIAEQIVDCFENGLIGDCCKSFARRAMADVAFSDIENNYFLIDIKTHNKSTSFNMPNLTSVDRLARFYEDDKNFFIVLMVVYDIIDERIIFSSVSFNPIEFLDWGCLTIGALGWGQIQIANSNNVSIKQASRKEWMLKLCDALEIFIQGKLIKFKKEWTGLARLKNFGLRGEQNEQGI